MLLKHGIKTVDTIFVHCAATRPEWYEGRTLTDKVAEIRRWHVEGNKWRDIGYHWIIDRDGSIAKGRDESEVGAHVAGRNTGSLGICLIGGFGSNEKDPFEKNFTPAQDKALRALIEEIQGRAAIKHIRGHNEVAAKACPGFQVSRWFKHQPASPKLSESTTMAASGTQVAAGAAAGVTAVASLDGTAQLVALGFAFVVAAAGAWIMRERIKRWAREIPD